jgi:DNA-binding HxlR family transcriptional regulator
MRFPEVAANPCSIARTLAILGERWTLLVLRQSFAGVRRYDEFQRTLGIARNVLADRLQTLVGEGILERRAYQERPRRFEYRLTQKGRDLYPVIVALMEWGDRYLAPDGPPMLLVHNRCGKETRPHFVCSECGEPIDPREMTPKAGPGLSPAAEAARAAS